MSRYIEAVKAEVRWRMSPPMRRSVAPISARQGFTWSPAKIKEMAWRLQREVVPASEKYP